MANLRIFLSYAIPSVTALLGLLWFLGRKKDERGGGKGKTGTAEEKHVSEFSSSETSVTCDKKCDTATGVLEEETNQCALQKHVQIKPVESQTICTASVTLVHDTSPAEMFKPLVSGLEQTTSVESLATCEPNVVSAKPNLATNMTTNAGVEECKNDIKSPDEVSGISNSKMAREGQNSVSEEQPLLCNESEEMFSQENRLVEESNPPKAEGFSNLGMSCEDSLNGLASQSCTSEQLAVCDAAVQSIPSVFETEDKSSQECLTRISATRNCENDTELCNAKNVSEQNSHAQNSVEECVYTDVTVRPMPPPHDVQPRTVDSPPLAVKSSSSSDVTDHDPVVMSSLQDSVETLHSEFGAQINGLSDSHRTNVELVGIDPVFSGSAVDSTADDNKGDVNQDVSAEENGARKSGSVGHNSESPVCDSNSEASNDSGHGGSVTETMATAPSSEIGRCEFNFPSELCGRLIGKFGKNINFIKEKSGANIALKNNPFTPDFQICAIEGNQAEIEKALAQIRKKFPRNQFPQVDLTPLSQQLIEAPVLMPDIMQLNLPEGVSVDIVVSSIVDAGHIFVQQPTHPTFPSLERLNQFMDACYTQDQMVPSLPRPVETGVICASFTGDSWFRAQIVAVGEQMDECDIKYVDYGGYARVQTSSLRQIRSDFMTLPFQAVECYMGNVTPLQEEEYFSEKASAVFEELTQGKLLQAQVINRAEDGIPYIHVYQIFGNRVLFINREMVNRRVVRWIEILQ